jgi:hypothetical protein
MSQSTSPSAVPGTQDAGFDTPLLVMGPLRRPRQMLQEQSYGDHASIHDESMATGLGLSGAPIEGPTHFSQFDPLLAQLWGREWFERGTISAHFQTMCVEGDEVRAGVLHGGGTGAHAQISAEKSDGTPVLTGTALLGEGEDTEVRRRLERARPLEDPVILDQLHVGQRGAAEERVRMDHDTHMGNMYPFSLAQKLEHITEYSPWYRDGSPWGPPIIPFEMVSVLTMSTSPQAGFARREPSVGLFIDLEVRMLHGPLLVGEEYRLEREILAMSESRRTESFWTRTTVVDPTDRPVAEVVLHEGVFKDSYPDYPADRLS